MTDSVEYLFDNKWLIKKLKWSELNRPPSSECSPKKLLEWHATTKLLPILQCSLPSIRNDYIEISKELKQVILNSMDGWINTSLLLSNSDEDFILHIIRWFYVGQFHCLIFDEIRKTEALYNQGLRQMTLIKSGKFEDAVRLEKELIEEFRSPKCPRGRPRKPFWLKLLMAYDFISLHCTNNKHSEYTNLQPPVADAWIVLDEISKKYKQIDSISFKKTRIFPSGDAVRQHLKGIPNMPGSRYKTATY